MKYRTKLYLYFIGMAFGSAFLAIGAFYTETRQILFGELRSKVLTAATTAANSLDGDAIAQIQTPADTDTSERIRELIAQIGGGSNDVLLFLNSTITITG